MPKLIGLIGYPIKHSISPHFQQAALDYYHLDARYEAWETSPGELRRVVDSLREAQNSGANVTVPYKEAVIPLLDEVDALAASIGAVNTIVKTDNRLLGFNTDAYGFIEALYKEGHFNPEGKQIVILGAGGVAKAVSFALVQQKASSILIINRTSERAKRLADSLKRYVERCSVNPEESQTRITALLWENLYSSRALEQCHLIVNCTTIGMRYSPEEGQSPLSAELIPESALVYDLVYNPRETPLLRSARTAGANILEGLAMLIYQGAASFELWTGKKAPIDIMFNKAEQVLQKGQG
jgi:shikimate dehydrogenase